MGAPARWDLTNPEASEGKPLQRRRYLIMIAMDLKAIQETSVEGYLEKVG